MTNANHQGKSNRGAWICGRLGRFVAACAVVLCAFGAMAAEVPKYYEYVETDGIKTAGEYVVLDYTPKCDSVVEAVVGHIDISKNGAIFCARGGSSEYDTFSLFSIAGSGFRWDYNLVGTTYYPNAAETKYVLTAKNTGLFIEGVSGPAIKTTPADFTTGNAMTLFGSHATAKGKKPVATGNFIKMRLYSFKAYDKEEGALKLKLELRPCVDTDGKAALYDAVNRTMYYAIATSNKYKMSVGGEEVFYEDPSTLIVSGSPEKFGEVSPAYGGYDGYVAGQSYSFSAPAVWTNAEETVAATCVGYKVYTNDIIYVEGSDNNFTYTHPDCEKGAKLVWQWTFKCKIVPTTRGNGSASVPGDGWFASGETATVTAVPAEGWSFKCWEGDVPEEQKFNATLHLPVGTTAPALTAVFGEPFFVSTTGDDGKSGRSWDEALATVEAALEKGGEEPCITVAEGLYDIQTAIKVTTKAAIVGSGERGAVFRLAVSPVAGDDTRAVFYVSNGDAVLRNLALTTGGAGRGRGLYLDGGTVAYCAITNCATVNGTMDGGGVYLKTGTLRDSFVHYNQATSSGNYQKYGGGIYMAGGLADRCVIRDNCACYNRGMDGSGHGGGVWMNAGTLRNSLVCGNIARTDASGVSAGGESRIESCTIVSNGSVSVEIPGVHLKGSATLMNSIAWGAIGQTSEVPNLTVDGTTVTLGNNVTDKGVDPVFVDAANGDFRIGFGPCVDQGVNQDWMVGATDLAGQDRIQGECVDIGCYEYTPKGFEVGVVYERLSAFCPGDVRFTASAGGATLDEGACWWTFDGREPTAADYDAIGSTVTRTMTPGEYTVRFKTVYNEKAYEVKKEKWFVLYGETVYVNPNCTSPAVPYASWETAATNINDALKCLVAGSTMIVSDGVYRVTNEQNLNRQVTIRSLNGPMVTKFTGSRPFHLNSSLATVAGFAFEKLDTWDGGAMKISNGTVSNCVFASCVIQNNGGAAVYMTAGTVVDCVVTNCSTRYAKGQSGAAIRANGANAFIDRCIVTGSYWQNAYTNNAAVALEKGAVMRNSVVADNRGGATGGVLLTGASAMENCTVTGNTAYFADGVGGVSAADTASVVNTIIWNNMNAKTSEASEKSGADAVYDTCCTEDPVFRGGKVQWRLKTTSPCMNAGKPLDWMDGAKDVYGNPRVLYGKPDIGAVESPYEPGLMLMVR